MSMAKCKCGKVFDSDLKWELDEKGNCCCDNCFQEIYVTMSNDMVELNDYTKEMLNKYGEDLALAEIMANFLIDKRYRKIK